MGKDEVLVALERRALEVPLQLTGDPVSERHGARRALRLGRSELLARVVATDSDPSRLPIDVKPAERRKLALPQSGHCRRQVQRALCRSQVVVGNGPQERFQLGQVEVANVRISG